MDDIARLLNRQAIEEVLARYCRGVDRCDVDTLASCYHPDGTDDHGTFVGNGGDFAVWATTGAAKVWAASHHSVHNVMIDWVNDDVAGVESYVLGFNHRLPRAPSDPGSDGDIELFAGRYLDRFERRDGVWRIAHRLALRDVDTLIPRQRWAGRITPGARKPHDPLYRTGR
ncbi:MAG: nuclear transport factor 2 family protein [Acidimicrobiales bacterium]